MNWPDVHQRRTNGLFEDEGSLKEHFQSTENNFFSCLCHIRDHVFTHGNLCAEWIPLLQVLVLETGRSPWTPLLYSIDIVKYWEVLVE